MRIGRGGRRHRHLLLAATLLVVAATGVAYSPSGDSFAWPNSSQYSRVIVNATQGIETRPKEWFVRDKVITDFAITNADEVGHEKAVKEFESTRRLLSSYGLAVGTYTSAVAVLPLEKETRWPWGAVPSDWMPSTAHYSGSWPDMPYRKLIDVTDAGTRRALQQGLKRIWQQYPSPVRFVDNAAAHRAVGGLQPWASYCDNIAEIRTLGESMGSLQIFNIAVHVEDMSDEETRQLIQAVGPGGILLEMPWPKDAPQHPVAVEKARQRYRQLLDTGMGIILAPPGAQPPQDLVNWVRGWRKATDHIYFGGSFYKAPDMNLFGPGGAA